MQMYAQQKASLLAPLWGAFASLTISGGVAALNHRLIASTPSGTITKKKQTEPAKAGTTNFNNNQGVNVARHREYGSLTPIGDSA